MTPLSAQPPPAPSLPPPNHLMQSPQPAPMPQLILASGQLVQGIQGAQLLIPTSQGKKIYLFKSVLLYEFERPFFVYSLQFYSNE